MKISLKKTVTAAMLAALTVALSGFYIPIGVSKCYPIQHMVNVLCAIFLGPGYGVMAAFCTSPDPEPHGNRKSPGLSGEHGGGAALRYPV